MSSQKLPSICIKPPAVQLLAQLADALKSGPVNIRPDSHFAARVKLILKEARRAGLLDL
jgi:hypothetical protein